MLHPSHALVELDFNAMELIPLQGHTSLWYVHICQGLVYSVHICWIVGVGIKLKVSAGILWQCVSMVLIFVQGSFPIAPHDTTRTNPIPLSPLWYHNKVRCTTPVVPQHILSFPALPQGAHRHLHSCCTTTCYGKACEEISIWAEQSAVWSTAPSHRWCNTNTNTNTKQIQMSKYIWLILWADSAVWSTAHHINVAIMLTQSIAQQNYFKTVDE